MERFSYLHHTLIRLHSGGSSMAPTAAFIWLTLLLPFDSEHNSVPKTTQSLVQDKECREAKPDFGLETQTLTSAQMERQ